MHHGLVTLLNDEWLFFLIESLLTACKSSPSIIAGSLMTDNCHLVDLHEFQWYPSCNIVSHTMQYNARFQGWHNTWAVNTMLAAWPILYNCSTTASHNGQETQVGQPSASLECYWKWKGSNNFIPQCVIINRFASKINSMCNNLQVLLANWRMWVKMEVEMKLNYDSTVATFGSIPLPCIEIRSPWQVSLHYMFAR